MRFGVHLFIKATVVVMFADPRAWKLRETEREGRPRWQPDADTIAQMVKSMGEALDSSKQITYQEEKQAGNANVNNKERIELYQEMTWLRQDMARANDEFMKRVRRLEACIERKGLVLETGGNEYSDDEDEEEIEDEIGQGRKRRAAEAESKTGRDPFLFMNRLRAGGGSVEKDKRVKRG